MRITAHVCGYYDWHPCPPGTEITEADIKALRVKQMADDAWHMRVEVKADTHHDVGIPEEAITRQMAQLEKLGREPTREAVVTELLRESFRHHLPAKHILKIEVVDDGPQAELYDLALAASEVDGDAADKARERYAAEVDLDQYLNVMFKTKGKAHAALARKEAP